MTVFRSPVAKGMGNNILFLYILSPCSNNRHFLIRLYIGGYLKKRTCDLKLYMYVKLSIIGFEFSRSFHNQRCENRNRKLLISRAPTKAKSQQPAYSQAQKGSCGTLLRSTNSGNACTSGIRQNPVRILSCFAWY